MTVLPGAPFTKPAKVALRWLGTTCQLQPHPVGDPSAREAHKPHRCDGDAGQVRFRFLGRPLQGGRGVSTMGWIPLRGKFRLRVVAHQPLASKEP